MNAVKFTKSQIADFIKNNPIPTEPRPVPSLNQFQELCEGEASFNSVRNCCRAILESLPDEIDTKEVNQLLEIVRKLVVENRPNLAKEILSQITQTNKLSMEQRSKADDYLLSISASEEVVLQTPSIIISIADDIGPPLRSLPLLPQLAQCFSKRSLSQEFDDFAVHCKKPNSTEETISQECNELVDKMIEKGSGATEKMFCGLLELGIELGLEDETKKLSLCIYSSLKNAVGSIPMELRYEVTSRCNYHGRNLGFSDLVTFKKFAEAPDRPMAAYDYWRLTQKQGNDYQHIWALEKAVSEGCVFAYGELSKMNDGLKKSRELNPQCQVLSKDVPTIHSKEKLRKSSNSITTSLPLLGNKKDAKSVDRNHSKPTTSGQLPKSVIQEINQEISTRSRNASLTTSRGRVRAAELNKLAENPQVRERAKSESAPDNKSKGDLQPPIPQPQSVNRVLPKPFIPDQLLVQEIKNRDWNSQSNVVTGSGEHLASSSKPIENLQNTSVLTRPSLRALPTTPNVNNHETK